MRRIISILCIVCLGLVLFVSGCTQQDNSGTNNDDNDEATTGNTYTMTAKEVENDMNFTSDWNATSGLITYAKLLYNSLEEGGYIPK